MRPLTFTLQCCLPLQHLPTLDDTRVRVLASLQPVLSPARMEALLAVHKTYFYHWTVLLAQLQLFVAYLWRANWAQGLYEYTNYLQHRDSVRGCFNLT
jgi:hypothetical protein